MSTEPDEVYSHSTSDGILEVLGIVSSFHIAQLQVGLSKPVRLGQAKSVKVKHKCLARYIFYNQLLIIYLNFSVGRETQMPGPSRRRTVDSDACRNHA